MNAAPAYPAFNVGNLRKCFTGNTVAEAEKKMDANLMVGEKRLSIRSLRNVFLDQKQAGMAAKSIRSLPAADECVHIIVAGLYSLFHVIDAVSKLAGCTISHLHISTLSYSKNNVDYLARLIDGGQIGRISLVYSSYFRGTSEEIAEYMTNMLDARGQRHLAMRTHAKILAMRLADGGRRTVTVESSANLRSCKNIEQVTMFGCREVYDFHVGWMEEMFGKYHARTKTNSN